MAADEVVHLAWITLGANLSPERHLPLAVMELQSIGTVLKTSSVWESDPVGFLDQPRFCNAALLLETLLEPSALKQALREIEAKLGRVRDPMNKNAPRTIDLDVAFYDDRVIHSDELIIPDPEIETRPFLAVPLAELEPEFLHPDAKRSLAEIASAIGRDALTLRPEIVL